MEIFSPCCTLLWLCEVSLVLHVLRLLCLCSSSLFVNHVLPTTYDPVRFCCPAAFSVLVARALKHAFLPSVVLFFTSLFNGQCLDVRSLSLARSSQTSISSFRYFLLVIKGYLFLDIHSFCPSTKDIITDLWPHLCQPQQAVVNIIIHTF